MSLNLFRSSLPLLVWIVPSSRTSLVRLNYSIQVSAHVRPPKGTLLSPVFLGYFLVPSASGTVFLIFMANEKSCPVEIKTFYRDDKTSWACSPAIV